MFSRHFTAFSYINIVKKIKLAPLFRGKIPFICNHSAFIKQYAPSLQNSISDVFNTEKLTALARESGFLRRESKLKPEEFVDALMFSDLNQSQLSLQDCCNDLAQQHQKSLSKVALHKRFNQRSLDFLKLVLAEQIKTKLDLGTEVNWEPFSKVLIADSSKFTLPAEYHKDYPGYGSFGNVSAIMNLQYAFDIKHGDWVNIELTKATQNDQSQSKKTLDRIGKGELHIRDLGFVTMKYLVKVIKEGAFFLNRLHPQWKPTQCDNGKRIDWTSLYKRMINSRESHFETNVNIGTGENAFSCRLVAVPVSEQVWTERIRKAQKKLKSMGSELSEEYKARCRFSIFITNVGEQQLKTADVIQVYRLRWQIELVFKSWKSLLSIHKVKAVKKERLECQLIAKFIWILSNWKIFRCINSFIQKTSKRNYACSMLKFFKQARRYSQAFREVIAGTISFKNWCKIYVCPIIKNLLIEPKKGKGASYIIVNDIFKE